MIVSIDKFCLVLENASNEITNIINSEIKDHFKDFLKWSEQHVLDRANGSRPIVSLSDWEMIKQRSEDGTISEDMINQGLCEEFAKYIQSKVPTVEIIGDPNKHVCVHFNGKYYDSENALGANSEAELYSDEAEFFKNRKK